jgi:hypothetical protein
MTIKRIIVQKNQTNQLYSHQVNLDKFSIKKEDINLIDKKNLICKRDHQEVIVVDNCPFLKVKLPETQKSLCFNYQSNRTMILYLKYGIMHL